LRIALQRNKNYIALLFTHSIQNSDGPNLNLKVKAGLTLRNSPSSGMYHSNRMTVKEIEEATGVSAATLYRSLKEEQTQ
jgi:hypothetical protein